MEKFNKKFSIGSLQDGQEIDDIFVVKIKKKFAPYGEGKGFYFNLLLTDASGKSIDYKYWGSAEESKVKTLFESISNDSVLRIQGKVQSYRNKLTISTNEPKICQVLLPEQFDSELFIKSPKWNIDNMVKELYSQINSVTNSELKSLLESVFLDEKILNKFKIHPGAIQIHHNWKGGLLQHTLEVVKICELMYTFNKTLDLDLMITGSLLHDLGKLEELEVTSRIKGTKAGQLHGHIIQGIMFLTERLNKSKMDLDLKNKLIHILISHHGKEFYGSPKTPMIPEAFVIYHADELSAKVAEITEFIEDSKNDTDDDFMYSARNKRNILLR